MKRLLLLLLLPLLCAWPSVNLGGGVAAAGGGGGGTPTFVRFDENESVDNSSPYTATVAVGASVEADDTIVVFCAVFDDSDSTPNLSISDSVNGAYTEHGNQASSTDMNIEVASVVSGAGTPTVTCTSDQTTGNAYFRVIAIVVTNLDTGGSRFLDATGADGESGTMTVGDITGGGGAENFYLSATAAYPPISGSDIGTYTDPASWTEIFNDNSSATTLAFGASRFLGTGTQAQTWSNSIGAIWVGIGVAFAEEP